MNKIKVGPCQKFHIFISYVCVCEHLCKIHYIHIWMKMRYDLMKTRKLEYGFFFSLSFSYSFLMHIKILILIQCVEKLNQLHIHTNIVTITGKRDVQWIGRFVIHNLTMKHHIERAQFCVCIQKPTNTLKYLYSQKKYNNNKQKKKRKKSGILN